MQKWRWREKREKTAFLALEDGSILRGHSVGANCDALGEVVFNTGMTGYEEILTDPSYNGQIVTMTYTEIGNTGINDADVESRGVFLNGFIVHEMNEPRNWRSECSLSDYLRKNDIPAIAGIDTRALTVRLRTAGTLKAFLCVTGQVSEADALAKAGAWEGLDGQDYAKKVTCPEPFAWDADGQRTQTWGIADELPETHAKVVAYDFGIKWNILRGLRLQGFDVTVVPAETPAADVLAMKPDGVFLSNGPADPAAVTYAIDSIRDLIGKVPLMGICLGHQLLGLALGGKTYRLKFGHHGCNHPVMDLTTQVVEITSQNHNFAVDADTLEPSKVEVTHINLNDNTVEGLQHKREPLFCVQYHPEAAPGPHDASYLFTRFRELIEKA
ncbi:MAG: glutamine-hydrolyzing carbamoyl-phosphate synthase small subunit [Lentisphaerae bacterium]|jgi:carbamoyl-phosphate synthase small subunit|nr:glutamine-hydrolyzing carbamoyl-phosphate synthase small subunit [Lentisphaerota bacterium]MBT5604475.1 glutamine-hydrolyzing carbamoyl-phosphate synthase small subunit [Lentisphaerota bacterium]MBT7060476.1 glutamine-hydrolyzing carbamoyl-phosphate synthase small subunit [Lentisphaerota bacterium]MBT7844383.1 glutamine-hydrolyzing carbamoyl-phosphate synthase small subunit [Lentisphaerota bacterium]